MRASLLFTALNIGALAIGGMAIRDGVTSTWYLELEKAPWTPTFFIFHELTAALVMILSLTALMSYFLCYGSAIIGVKSW